MSLPTDRELYLEYQRVVRETGFDSPPGRIDLLGWDIEYNNSSSILAFIDQILFRKMNDFCSDNEQPVILDCGANIGYTVLHYKRQYPSAHIIAFEPDPEVIPLLHRNVDRNGLSNVEIVEAAAWIADGSISWITGSVDGSHIARNDPPTERMISVPTIDLVNYLQQPVDLLKVDIEGAEFVVIPHLRGKLAQVKNVLVEIHITDPTKYLQLEPVIRTLVEAGFVIGLNSWGPWRDLVRQPDPPKYHSEQYLLLAGWRERHPSVSRDADFRPYYDIVTHQEYRTAAEDARREISELLTELSWQRDLNHGLGEALASTNSHRPKWKSLRLSNFRFYHDEGFCWEYDLPLDKTFGDSSDASSVSSLLILEDGVPLGPAHTPHSEIRLRGNGCYSHWAGALYFSSSNGTDPCNNGKNYTVWWKEK